MCVADRRIAFVFMLAFAVLGCGTYAQAGERAAYLAACEKEHGAPAKAACACVADKVDQAFKDKGLGFAYDSLSMPIGELVNSESGLSEQQEDQIVDQTYGFMKDCGLIK